MEEVTEKSLTSHVVMKSGDKDFLSFNKDKEARRGG